MQNISCQEFQKMRDNKEQYMLIDVREPDEWNSGHFEEAINIPTGKIQAEFEKIVPDKNAKVVLHCARGSRSKLASTFLEMRGYTNLYNLEGGYLGYCENVK